MINNKKVVMVMPIKQNNERLPGKNTMKLGGKPLINWQLDIINEIDEIDEKYVYCSTESIKQYLPNNVLFLKRDKNLDLPTANFNEIFGSFVRKKDSEIYLYAHATAPFVSKETIRMALNKVAYEKYDSAFCALKIQDFLWKDGKPMNFDAEHIPRSQDIEVIWRETSGVYVFDKKVFQEKKRRIGDNPYILEMSYKEAIDINTFEDFELAKKYID